MSAHAVDLRDLIPFEPAATETDINGIVFNLTTLRHWNYTEYSNGTISNGSLCFLLFDPYTPFLLQNGTFLNSTSCYSAIEHIRTRGILGLIFTSLFALSIMFTFVNLRKHSRLFFPSEKRFRAVGRKWQWYWMLAVAGCGMASGITGVDVDRYYLPELPIVLCSFFYFLMLPMIMAAVWESVRHWGSWQERQVLDSDPFFLRQDDLRSRIELYLPLVFYFFAFLYFFMTIPRSWSAAEKQRDLKQQNDYAKLMATDIRFKVAALFLLLSWLTIVFYLWHSIKHYKARNRGLSNRVAGGVRYIPVRFILTLSLALVLMGYTAASAFNFDIGVIKVQVEGEPSNVPWLYALGWTPIASIILVQEVSGYLLPNEDRALIRQRRERSAAIDQEMGIVKKPDWWSRLHGDQNLNVHDVIARNVKEVGGGQATTRNLEKAIKMGTMPSSRAYAGREGSLSQDQRPAAVRIDASLLVPTPPAAFELPDPFSDGMKASEIEGRGSRYARSPVSASDRSSSTQSVNIFSVAPQRVRSMLDV